jgi:hypothetical protein
LEQARLLLRRELAELGIVFEGATLLRRRQVFIAAEPVSCVSGAVLGRTGRSIFISKAMPLSIGLRLGRARRLGGANLGERRRQQQPY